MIYTNLNHKFKPLQFTYYRYASYSFILPVELELEVEVSLTGLAFADSVA